MIHKGRRDPENEFRVFYDLDKGNGIQAKHFVVRTTTTANPFVPHAHEQEELWYVLEGKGSYFEDGAVRPVEAGDLIHIRPRVLHGLSSDSKIVWICLG